MGRLLNSKRVKTRRVPCPTCIFVSKRFWSTSKTNKCIKPLYVISKKKKKKKKRKEKKKKKK